MSARSPLPSSETAELSEVDLLREEVDDLRTEVNHLRRELKIVKRAIGLETVPEASRSRDSRGSPSYTPGSPHPSSYSTPQPSPEPERAGASLPAGRGAGYSGLQSVPPPLPSSSAAANGPGRDSSSASGGLTWLQREEICDKIGKFISRSLEGNHRGASGRDQLPQGSKLWVIVRDHWGQIYTPVKVVRTWTSCKVLVKPGQDPGDSIFIGLPSEREARRVVHSAGLDWPQAIEQ